MGLLVKGAARKSLIRKVFYPNNMFKFLSTTFQKKGDRARYDVQLEFVSKLLTKDFLHYGYFEDKEIAAQDISLGMIERAQVAYAQLLIDQLKCESGDVLDVGCGMGGLIPLLRNKGHKPWPLTPDRAQASFIRNKYPEIDLFHCRFEELEKKTDLDHKFQAVINSESLQYINLDKAFELVLKFLKPGGTWIIADYFRQEDAKYRSGHFFEQFHQKVKDQGFTIEYEQDITENILPTIKFAYYFGNRLGLPLFEFLGNRIQYKAPSLHFLLDEILEQLEAGAKDQLEIVNPEVFAREKRYMVYVLKRPEA
jgi:cyclopropane fatty-acyl-phospholipid synthase-like methyltransferase